MRADDVQGEIAMLRRLGVEIRSGVTVGDAPSLAQLEREFDAIFIGVGLGETEDLHIPGEDLAGCRDALSFIEETKSKGLDKLEVTRRVAVIGGGNTAIDAVTAAHRLGAEEVFMVYRRSQEEMSAFGYEYELAKRDNVTFVWRTMPLRVVDDGNGHVAALECVRAQRGAKGPSGRHSAVPVPGTEFRLDVSMVIKALGQKRRTDFLKSVSGVQQVDGCVVVDPETMRTGNPLYFAGGDCVNGGGEVVDAVAHGKRAAAGIHEGLVHKRT
jgi:glutamate synthase (NADPH/NADH) small chain